MASLLSKTKRPATSRAARPPAAIEITAEGVVAAALPAGGGGIVYAYEALPAGQVKPGTAEGNLHDLRVVTAAVKQALDAVEPRSHSVTVVIPDLSARVFVLDFDALPEKAADVDSVLKFRLRKMVPFEVEQSGVGYQALDADGPGMKLLVSVIPLTILAEYEQAVRNAGYEPGVVLPAGLAVLAAIDDAKSTLMANLSAHSLTTAVTRGNDLLLYRTVELPREGSDANAARLDETQRDLAVASAYYEDRIGDLPGKLHYAGNGGTASFAEWIGEPDAQLAALALVDIAKTPTTGVVTSLGSASVAAVNGALAGVN